MDTVCLGKCQQFHQAGARVCGGWSLGGGEGSLGRAVGNFLKSKFGAACRALTMEGLMFPTQELGGLLY